MVERGRIADPAVVRELEHLYARLRGFFSQSFDVDGNLIVADPNYAVVPVGGMLPFGGTSAPTGYLMCDGAQVNRVTYKTLFDVIGTDWGAGDGSTTFNLPDARGKSPLGKAASGTGSTLGGSLGSLDHTHAGGAHTHAISSDGGHSHSVDSHAHSIGDDGSHRHELAVSGQYEPGGTGWGLIDPETTEVGHHDHGGATGLDSPNTNFQPAHSHGGATGAASGTTGSGNHAVFVTNMIIFAGV